MNGNLARNTIVLNCANRMFNNHCAERSTRHSVRRDLLAGHCSQKTPEAVPSIYTLFPAKKTPEAVPSIYMLNASSPSSQSIRASLHEIEHLGIASLGALRGVGHTVNFLAHENTERQILAVEIIARGHISPECEQLT